MNKKDQDAIAKLYLESRFASDDYQQSDPLPEKINKEEFLNILYNRTEVALIRYISNMGEDELEEIQEILHAEHQELLNDDGSNRNRLSMFRDVDNAIKLIYNAGKDKGFY